MKSSIPIALSISRVWRTYIGGRHLNKIQKYNGLDKNHYPETWMMSTTLANNGNRTKLASEGLSLIKDDVISLHDLIQKNPNEMVGPNHKSQYGETTGVLVKIIDADERLTIQVHPNREKALKFFNSKFGKVECWHILDPPSVNGENPYVYVGFKESINKKSWVDLFERQDIQGMLNLLHKFEVNPGDTIIINGGLPHAIGANCFLLEIQEPTDYTLRTERSTPNGLKISDEMCHQSIGFEKMFDCFDYTGLSRQETKNKWFIPKKSIINQKCYQIEELIGYSVTPFFKMDRIIVYSKCTLQKEEMFFGLFVFTGEGQIEANNSSQKVKSGDEYFIPYACPSITLKNSKDKPLVIYRFFGPEI